MKLCAASLLILTLPAALWAGELPAGPEQAYQDAWYVEEGLREPLAAVQMYNDIAAKYQDNPDLAARALTRAAGCYKKLGQKAAERDTWKSAWDKYKDQIENSPEYQTESTWIRSTIRNALSSGPPLSSGMARIVNDILDRMDEQHVSPLRDEMLRQAQEQWQNGSYDTVSSLTFAIDLSRRLKDLQKAAAAQSNIGRFYLEQGDYIAAIEAYDTAKREYPNQPAVLAWNQMRMAEAFRLMDMTENAISSYAELLRSYPEQKEQVCWAKLWIGNCYRELKQLEPATKYWNEVAENPEAEKFPRPRRIARILAGAENPPDELDLTAKDEFTNDEAYFIAVRHRMNGAPDTALRFLEAAIKQSNGKDWPRLLAENALLAQRRQGEW